MFTGSIHHRGTEDTENTNGSPIRAHGSDDVRRVVVVRWGRGVKGEEPLPTFVKGAVQHERMEVDIQSEAAAETLDHRSTDRLTAAMCRP